MKNILILGSTGLLGENLKIFLSKKKYKVFNHGNNIKTKYNYDLTPINR